jgi:hypothetical protein
LCRILSPRSRVRAVEHRVLVTAGASPVPGTCELFGRREEPMKLRYSELSACEKTAEALRPRHCAHCAQSFIAHRAKHATAPTPPRPRPRTPHTQLKPHHCTAYYQRYIKMVFHEPPLAPPPPPHPHRHSAPQPHRPVVLLPSTHHPAPPPQTHPFKVHGKGQGTASEN